MKKMMFLGIVCFAAFLMTACELPDISWKAVDNFQNGWTSDPGSAPVEYCRDAQGFVHIRGTANDSDAMSSVSTMFVLPAGYRPAYEGMYTVYLSVTGVSEAGAVQIDKTGTVVAIGGANIWTVFFGEVIFYAG